MVKREQGIVVGVKGNIAHVKVGRHEECTGCGACPSSQRVMVDAVNGIGAQPGQRVRFEMREEHVLLGAFVVFLMPLIAAGIGGAIGWQLGMQRGTEEPWSAVAGALISFGLSLLGVKFFDRQASKDQNMKPVIIEIL